MEDINIQISIVVPIYNVENYLKKCLDSIINQTYRNLEIILVDDGSTDCCPEICDYYSRIDNRIKVIHKKNGGLVSARKAGTSIATGDYILNVDGDDWIETDRIEILVKEGIIPSQADMIYLAGYKKDYINSSILIDNDIPIKTFYSAEIRKQIFPLLMSFNEGFCIKVYCSLCLWAISRKLLQAKQKLVDNRITIGEDGICIWFCLLSAKKIKSIRQNGYHYIQRSSSMVSKAATSPGSNYFPVRVLYHQLKKYLETCNVSKEIYQIFIYAVIYYIIVADYKILLNKYSHYLFPYTKIKKGDKIIIYGAGRMGHSLLRYLLDTKDYHIVLWIDKNEKKNAWLEYKISSVEAINEVSYDYIIIAVMSSDIAKDIKNTLIMKGVSKNKIETMDSNVITEDAIPKEISRDEV